MKQSVLLVILVSSLCFGGIITDSFEDGIIANGPDTGAPPASWSGNIDTEPGWQADGAGGVYGHHPGLACTDDTGAMMTLDFGALYGTVEVDFELRQENGTGGSYRIEMGFVTDQGTWLMESSPEAFRYGGGASATSIASFDGNHAITWPGVGVAPQQKLPTNGYQHFKFVFDVSEYFTVKVYTEDYTAGIDESKGYGTLVYAAYMENWISGTPATGATGFAWKNLDGVVTWQVDDVVVTPEPVSMLIMGIGGLFLRRR